jgi:hypothetical protein
MKNANEKIFKILNKRQMKPAINFVIINNYSLAILKKKVENFYKNYE